MTYRVMVYLPEESQWEDTTEGPFDSYEQAEDFARAEVGLLWWIEPVETPASMNASELNAENDRLEHARETLIPILEREYGIEFDLSKLTRDKRETLKRAQSDPRWQRLITEYRAIREQIDAEFPERVITRLPEGYVRRNDFTLWVKSTPELKRVLENTDLRYREYSSGVIGIYSDVPDETLATLREMVDVETVERPKA